ncbi:uncharacterized protein TRIADDRAFT_23733 [Trichoplax adhaerens]|uniref:carnitine O-palmitoyltransferase n=1 Tax=Trichoplax adhaerens TaxID=10228 RepID=B3RV71_TRIAD|nr:hypothetical protein TRIADDRAFT_23733 [Trichoplax adhaerens]EDV25450.1 hypothetical protein TRIADDRAFT_23733 [Trichoplax adhaerens]|eukprot:XP_002111483.1 hypothetical protein TRIADDRAFT_23733 [Trichoplax adhaerens]
MAEARQAVAFQFTITSNGIFIDFNQVGINNAIQTVLHAIRLKWRNFRNSLHKSVFPNSAKSYLIIAMVLVLLRYLQFGPVKYLFQLEAYIPTQDPRITIATHVVILATVLWITLAYFKRYMLKVLLMYKGWIFESGGKISLQTKIWYGLINMLKWKGKLQLLSYQSSLPRLPVPSLESTTKRYLQSVRPLVNDEKYDRMAKLANEFQNGIGCKLQRYLVLYSWWASNYVSSWWENYVYLRSRESLLINSNYYMIDGATEETVTNRQAARAASITRSVIQYRQMIDDESLEPLILRDSIPMCCKQHLRQMNTARLPGKEFDKIAHYSSSISRHIAVLHKGRYYKLDLYRGPRWLKLVDLEKQFQRIIDDEEEPLPSELHLAALTAVDRTRWATIREEYFSNGINKQSLDVIEKSAFVLVLDDTEQFYQENDPSKFNSFCKACLCGNGYNRWFDKSMTAIIYANGRFGANLEHTFADAPIFGHLLEYLMTNDASPGRFKPDGHCDGESSVDNIGRPTRLKWDIPSKCCEEIEDCAQIAKSAISDLDLYVLDFTEYGKGYMKTCKVSPDGYMQMALQLTYYRLSRQFCLTYESSMTRLYREGRTETVRPVTTLSTEFVHTMCDKKKSSAEKRQALRNACENHAMLAKEAMLGYGIDRHLFCLYVVSKYLKLDSPFLKEVLSEPWRLSTSQTPHRQTKFCKDDDYDACAKKLSAGGGFGPVADDGYGVSYIFTGNRYVVIHITSKKSCRGTGSEKFAKMLRKSLLDMRKIFQDS